ncbi:MAG: hypothetical protein A3K19_33545 [Lentisphaerae bacterium RIFOXYB12_FULL_65_16]|nr:MAG: hypothetical protein A3K18_06030 [Lentisphaerae bacterium RIFOXYA12_64_32]OGV86953.1 MAG: hypothetical protein A3K19_33545 [Lentisphaerae bacterium RIFOXYB12_FULL_65_16]
MLRIEWMRRAVAVGLALLAFCDGDQARLNGAETAELAAPSVNVYVAIDGNDAWSGTLAIPNEAKTDGPFATPERARDEIRKLKVEKGLPPGGVTVELREGTYELAQPFALTEADSGTAEAPVTYRGRQGETVRLTGGRGLTNWTPVTDPAIVARLDEAARPHVLLADMKAAGITQFSEMVSAKPWAESQPGLELFFNDEPMTLARWPNEGYSIITGFPPDAKPAILWGKPAPNSSVEGRFLYGGDRPLRWAAEKNIMLHGFWFWDWADQRLKVESIDVEKRSIALESKPQHHFGFRKGQWYYAYNLLPELDQPGEWYLDRERGILYFWPPSDLSNGRAVVSVLPSLVTMDNVSYVTLRGITFEATQGTAVTITGGSDVRIAGCVIRNTGSWGIQVKGGDRHQVIGCDLYATGDGGVILDGGDRNTLTPAGHAVENCHIHHYSRWDPMYKPGVQLRGVGSRVSHCLIHDAPHMGIAAPGNDHVVEYNECHSLVFLANDAEAIHGGWYDWTTRGTIIRYNYIHDCFGHDGHGCKAIRLDDHVGGLTLFGNVIERIWCEQGRGAITIHGGRDNLIENNLFVDCDRGVRIHKCNAPPPEKSLEKVPYRQPPWSERYPKLATILDDEPGLPKNNVVVHNVNQGGEFMSTDTVAAPITTVKDNFTEGDPKIVRAANGIPTLAPDSPALAVGFQPIPVEKIGLYPNELRASWPVTHTVRPTPPRPVKPIVERKVRKGGVPQIAASRAQNPITLDGVIAPGEWPAPGVPMKETPDRQPIAGAPAMLYVAYDNENLYVAVTVPIKDAAKLDKGETWGVSDAAELCLRNASKTPPGPIAVLRGFLTGRLDAAPDAGMHPEDILRLTKTARFAARTDAANWVGEWVVPFAALEASPQSGLKLGFNVGVRRTESDEWIIWAGALGATWQLNEAGLLVLQ